MKVLPVLDAIRQYCLFCRRYDIPKVNNCGIRHCSLWPYRMRQIPASYTDTQGDGPMALEADKK